MEWYLSPTCPCSNATEVRDTGDPALGRGVFATRRLRRGEVVAFYDGVFVKIPHPVYRWMLESVIARRMGYNQGVPDEEWTCIGFADPLRRHGIGPMMNTGHAQRGWGDERPRANNCERQFCTTESGKYIVKLVTLRTVQAGEQLFVDYGAQYWCDHPRLLTPEQNDVIGDTLGVPRTDSVEARAAYVQEHFEEIVHILSSPPPASGQAARAARPPGAP